MFKDKFAVQTRIVKVDDTSGVDTNHSLPTIDPEQINTLLKDQVLHAGKVVGAIIAGIFVLHTASEVIINNTNPANR